MQNLREYIALRPTAPHEIARCGSERHVGNELGIFWDSGGGKFSSTCLDPLSECSHFLTVVSPICQWKLRWMLSNCCQRLLWWKRATASLGHCPLPLFRPLILENGICKKKEKPTTSASSGLAISRRFFGKRTMPSDGFTLTRFIFG